MTTKSKPRPARRFRDADQAVMDALSVKFWDSMRAMPPMRKATLAELRLLTWCEASALCYQMKLFGCYSSDPWRIVFIELKRCNQRGDIHVGHVLAMLATSPQNKTGNQ